VSQGEHEWSNLTRRQTIGRERRRAASLPSRRAARANGVSLILDAPIAKRLTPCPPGSVIQPSPSLVASILKKVHTLPAGVSLFSINAFSLRQRVMRLPSRRSLLVAAEKWLRSLLWPQTQTGSVSFQLRKLSKKAHSLFTPWHQGVKLFCQLAQLE